MEMNDTTFKLNVLKVGEIRGKKRVNRWTSAVENTKFASEFGKTTKHNLNN